jgi:hypothetical protein
MSVRVQIELPSALPANAGSREGNEDRTALTLKVPRFAGLRKLLLPVDFLKRQRWVWLSQCQFAAVAFGAKSEEFRGVSGVGHHFRT